MASAEDLRAWCEAPGCVKRARFRVVSAAGREVGRYCAADTQRALLREERQEAAAGRVAGASARPARAQSKPLAAARVARDAGRR